MQSIADAVMLQVAELVKQESERSRKTLERLKEIAMIQAQEEVKSA